MGIRVCWTNIQKAVRCDDSLRNRREGGQVSVYLVEVILCNHGSGLPAAIGEKARGPSGLCSCGLLIAGQRSERCLLFFLGIP